MTLYTLKHRDVSEVERVLEGSIRLVAGLALAIRETAEIDRVLEGSGMRVLIGRPS